MHSWLVHFFLTNGELILERFVPLATTALKAHDAPSVPGLLLSQASHTNRRPGTPGKKRFPLNILNAK